MKLFEGNIVKLSGVSRHGKNRIRENGELWRVSTVDGQASSILTTKICVHPVNSESSKNWRWIDIPEDEHMKIEALHLIEEPEHVADERKVDEAIERMRDKAQQDMFNDETMNWSGLR